jgi:hypothetical protein
MGGREVQWPGNIETVMRGCWRSCFLAKKIGRIVYNENQDKKRRIGK